MPKKTKMKRRKIVKRDCIDDIPYFKYRVEWVDCVSDSGWADKTESDTQSTHSTLYLK